MAAGATYNKIESKTLTSDTAFIEFTSIPATYTDLKISLIGGQNSNNDAITFRFNGDTGANYTSSYMIGTGSGASGNCSNDTTSISNYGDLGGTALETFIDININGYAETNSHKSVLSYFSGVQRGRASILCGLWRNNAAIHTVKIDMQGTDLLKSGTIATLYGIARA